MHQLIKHQDRNRCAVSFSGGRSSAVMTDLLWKNRDWFDELNICFVNVGCEHEATLDFVHECSQKRFPVTWIEPVIDPELGKGVRHRVVTYETASRNGEPFEDYISKHGIPGPTNPNCTNYLKEECMNAYRRDALGWKKRTYLTAIGIRADEVDRMNARAEDLGFIYPLVTSGITKQAVAGLIKEWGFDLRIPNDAHGNCVWCWKKSLRKLITVAQEDHSAFDFPLRMEEKYKRNRQSSEQEDRLFFRNRLRTADLLKLAKDPVELAKIGYSPYRDDSQLTIFDQIGWDSFLDAGGGCGDSCEIGSDA